MSSDAYLLVSKCSRKGSLGRVPLGDAGTPLKEHACGDRAGQGCDLHANAVSRHFFPACHRLQTVMQTPPADGLV